MSQIIQLALPVEQSCVRMQEPDGPDVCTDAIHIVFTTIDETLAAARVAAALGKAMRAPLTLIHFRKVPYPLSVDAPAGLSPVETESFMQQLRGEEIDARLRVYLCRNERRVIPF